MTPQACALEKLQQWSPFECCVWRGLKKPITREEVSRALAEGRLRASPIINQDKATRRDHIRRIAFLVQHGWTDAISLDVGVPVLGHHVDWIVVDGNHRLAAAFYRGDTSILVEVDGQIDYAERLLGVAFD